MKKNIVIFLFLAVIVVILQYLVNIPLVLNKFITGDDFFLLYNFIQYDPNIFKGTIDLWIEQGPHTTYVTLYLGLLYEFFGLNYKAWIIVNIIAKILASLSIFPLILVLFKSRKLAFLTTIFFSISYTSAGSLIYIMTGIEYISFVFMNLFFISYYYAVQKGLKLHKLILPSLLLLIAYFTAPIRVYPIFAIILLLQLYILIFLRLPILRVLSSFVLIILPSLLLTLPVLKLMGSSDSNIHTSKLISSIITGNWHYLLVPLSVLGKISLPLDYLNILWKVDLTSYVNFIVSTIPLISSIMIISIILSILIVKNHFSFFLKLMTIYFVVQNIIFFLLISYIRKGLNLGLSGYTYSTVANMLLLGAYIFSVSLIISLRLFTDKGNRNLFIIAAGPLYSLIFVSGSWIVLGNGLLTTEGISRYFTFSVFGISFLFASFFYFMLQKAKNYHFLKILTLFIILIFIIVYTKISGQALDIKYGFHRNINLDLNSQIAAQNKVANLVLPFKQDMLIYVEQSDNKKESKFWHDAIYDISPSNLLYWLYIKRGEFLALSWEGCMSVVDNIEELQKSIIVLGDVKGIRTKSLCINTGTYARNDFHFFNLEDFRAISISNGEIKDSTKDVVNLISPLFSSR